jgi:hypothetical protein
MHSVEKLRFLLDEGRDLESEVRSLYEKAIRELYKTGLFRRGSIEDWKADKKNGTLIFSVKVKGGWQDVIRTVETLETYALLAKAYKADEELNSARSSDTTNK